MSEVDQPYRGLAGGVIAVEAPEAERAAFIQKAYLHLLGAVAAFVGLEAALFSMPGIENLAIKMVSGYNWLIVLGAFMLVSYVAERMAHSAVSLSSQYLALALTVLAWSVIFVPMLYFARMMEANLGVGIIAPAATGTLALFTVLTAIVFVTRVNFSFLRTALWFGGFLALGLILCSIVFGFNLGILFTVAMIGFACLWVLYDTSKVLHDYRTDQYVVAALALFASLALLFWYILRLAMWLAARGGDD